MDEEQALSQEDEVRRGRRAEALMRDPLIVEAFETMDAAFYDTFRLSDVNNSDQLLRIRLLIKCLDEFKAFFQIAITDGRLTQEVIEDLAKEDRVLERLERQRLRG